MKFKDYRRLGKISIKSRKKSTRNTVRGIAFGLTMIIPVLFLSLAIKLDIGNTINDTHHISTSILTTNSQDETFVASRYGESITLPGSGASEEVLKRATKSVEYSSNFKYLSIDFRYSEKIYSYINDEKNDIGLKLNFLFNNGYANIDSFGGVKIYSDTSKLVPDSYLLDLENSNYELLKAGTGFSDNPKGEILISERFADVIYDDVESLIGKKFDLQLAFRGGYDIKLDNDNDPNNEFMDDYVSQSAYIFDDFIIKGIISDDYYKLNNLCNSDADFWIAEASYDDGNGPLKPILTKTTKGEADYKEEFLVATYVEPISTLEEKAKKSKTMLVAYPAIRNYSPYYYKYNGIYLTEPVSITLFQSNNYEDAVITNNIIKSVLKSNFNISSDYDGDYFASTNEFQSFKTLNSTAQYLIIGLSIFGGIIFFATLLNLYNSINYSVDSRHNYLAMMRAIGAKNKVIPRLYLVEILLIFIRSLPWAIIFSFGISYGIKYSVDQIFKSGSEIFATTIQLSINYYFVALVVVLVLILLIGLLFSFIACRPVTHKKILDIFDDDK